TRRAQPSCLLVSPSPCLLVWLTGAARLLLAPFARLAIVAPVGAARRRRPPSRGRGQDGMRIPPLLPGALLAACLLFTAGGCRSGSAPLAPVRGKVSYRGQLLRGGTIVFTPDAGRGNRGELACADIQPDGSYALKTGEAAGAAP